MPYVPAPDRTRLAFHLDGAGQPLICLPGGPMQASAYLGDLGGLSSDRELVRLDLRGTGDSAVPTDPDSYCCGRQVADVEALRLHLGLDRIDLLAHSAGTNLAVEYVVRHPERVARLILVTPSVRALGVDVSDEIRQQVADLRRTEEWFPAAAAALRRVQSGTAGEDDWKAVGPFFYGRWDAAAQAHHRAQDVQTNHDPAAVFGGQSLFDHDAIRSALAGFTTPTQVVAGELDMNTPPTVAAELTRLFRGGRLVVQPGAGHFPWLDDSGAFAGIVAGFLADPSEPAG